MRQFNKIDSSNSKQYIAYVDIDNTICFYKENQNYTHALPLLHNIKKINLLYKRGWKIIYWTARGASTGINWKELTLSQLKTWGCKFHELKCGKEKGSFDVVIDDKSLKIEDLWPQTIGFACSCFDLLHSGHALMLKDCKNVCDYLIVGLQTDPTLDRPTKNKPIQSLEERRIMIESIKYVDEVVIYNTESDLLKLLNEITPDIRIMGSDWKGKKFTGHQLNIPIHWHQRDHNYSSTNLRKNIFLAEKENVKFAKC